MIFIPTVNERLSQELSSLYIYMPESTKFLIETMDLTAVDLRDMDMPSSKEKVVYLTKDGWIWKDEWEIITAMTTRPVISNEDGLWRYKHNALHYPLMMCKKINWAELELKHLFS
jgi:hypothetical protein